MAKASGSAIRAGRAFVELFADDTLLVRGLKRAEARVRRFGKNIHDIGRRLATIGLAMSIPFAASTKTFADFDDTMRAVKAVTGATIEQFEELTEKALLLGRTTSFTARQVAEAMLQLGRAGFQPGEIDNSIKSILDLSRATRTDLAESARIASASLRAFDMDAKEMPRVCDVMVAAANNSAQTLEDLGFSMSYCAPIAAQYGMTIEETCKAIGALSNYGIKASQAGTTFRRILVNLADKRVQRRLKGLGVEITSKDTGKMRNASAILKDLGKSMRFMSESQQISLTKDLFGVWAMAGSAKLTVAQFDKLYESIDNASGVANQVAHEMDAGIGGRLRILWSEIEAVRIAIGEALAPALIRMANYWIQATSGLVKYLRANKEMLVQSAKLVAYVTGIGLALMGSSFILLTVAKIVSLATGVLGAALAVLFLPFNLLAKIGNAVLFAGAALVNVFSAVGMAVYRAGAFVLLFVQTFYAATNMIGGMLILIVSQSVRAIAMLSGGLVTATMMIVRAVAVSLSAIIPIVTTVFGTVLSLLAPLTSLVGTLLAGVFVRVGAMIAGLSFYFAPLVSTALWAMSLIGAAVTGAFLSIATVIRASFLNVGAAIAATVARAMAAMSAMMARLFAQLAALTAAFFARMTATAGTALVVVTAQTTTAIGHLAWTVAAQMGYVVGVVGAVIAHCIAVVGAAVTSLLLAMSPWAVVLLTIGAVAGAIFLLVRNIGVIASVFTTVFQTVMRVVSTVVSWIASAVLGVLGFLVRPILAVVAWIASGIWSLVASIGAAIGSAIGSVVSSIRGAFASAWNGVVAMFASVLSGIGGLVANFGTFFAQAFAAIGEAFDWFKGRIGEVFGFFKEAYDAIAVALGRGDIEAALGVVWAGLKLMWVKGSQFLLETWYWLTGTLQTAWATCVFKISELLLTAWYGVQQFWTETVYTMQTLWVGFMDSLIGAWQYAEKLIKKGVGYIKALWQGTDPKDVLTGIDDEYDRKAKEREKKRMASLNAIQQNRDGKQAALEAEKQGALGILQDDLATGAAQRQAAYQSKVAGHEAELEKARREYDEAIRRAKTPPEEEDDYSPWDMKQRKLNNQLQDAFKGFRGMGGLNGLLGDKAQSSGTFNAFEVGSLNDGIGEEQLAELRTQTAMLRNLKFKGIPWKED